MNKASMSPEMIRNFVLRTVAFTHDRDIISKDAALINPSLTPTVVDVVGSMVTHPISEEEEKEFGAKADAALNWVKNYSGNKEFVLNVKDQLHAAKPNPSIMVWIWKLYASELGRLKHLDDVREMLDNLIDKALLPLEPSTPIHGLADLKLVTNGYQGCKVLHLVDRDTRRYIRYNVFGTTKLTVGDLVSYKGKAKNTIDDIRLGLTYTQITRSTLTKV